MLLLLPLLLLTLCCAWTWCCCCRMCEVRPFLTWCLQWYSAQLLYLQTQQAAEDIQPADTQSGSNRDRCQVLALAV